LYGNRRPQAADTHSVSFCTKMAEWLSTTGSCDLRIMAANQQKHRTFAVRE